MTCTFEVCQYDNKGVSSQDITLKPNSDMDSYFDCELRCVPNSTKPLTCLSTFLQHEMSTARIKRANCAIMKCMSQAN